MIKRCSYVNEVYLFNLIKYSSLHPPNVLQATGNGDFPAHEAAQHGHDECLRVLHDLGAGETLFTGNVTGTTPAGKAAFEGRAECLRTLYVFSL